MKWSRSFLALAVLVACGEDMPIGPANGPDSRTLLPSLIGGEFAYVVNRESDNVSVIRTSDNTVITTVAVGNDPGFVAFTPGGAFAYVSNEDLSNSDEVPDNVSVIRTSDHTVIASVTVGANPAGLAVTPDDAFVYVANVADGTVSVIDTSTHTVVATVDVGSLPVGLDITPDGSLVYVADTGDETVSVIQTSDNTVIATIDPAPGIPYDVAITPDGNFAYVSRFEDGDGVADSVDVIEISSNTVVETIVVGEDPWGLGNSPLGTVAYVGNNDSDDVSVIRLSDNAVIATIIAGISPFDAAFTPDGAFAYVPNRGLDGVSVIRTSDHTVIETVTVGDGPRRVAVAPARLCTLVDLGDKVNALGPEGNGTLNKGQTNALLKKVNQAGNLIDKNKPGEAIGVLEDLVQQVEDLEGEAVLDAEQADELTGCAEEIIEELEG